MLHSWNALLSELSAPAVIMLFAAFTGQACLVRNGLLVRRVRALFGALTLVFLWYWAVQLDRMHDIFPGVDLAAATFEYVWVPRALLIVTCVRFWVALRGE